MTISYNWLSTYLPLTIDPERLSGILTSVGLEVEKMETFEEIRGGLAGLVIGEVLGTEPHPNADKLKLAKVSVGAGEPLQVVCGAPNVAGGQKVVVAQVGTTIYPVSGAPLTMKVAKIRGVESRGMICAEDEIGMGHSHEGIMVLPEDAVPGTPAADYFKPYSDIVYEIGLTPNRMDAMSHWGVARDVCAYLSHHEGKKIEPVYPAAAFSEGGNSLPIAVTVKNTEACPRYSGVCIEGVQVGSSPQWLQRRLLSIGLRPINNIVDITNFIQHETGQPLHAFDYDAIGQQQVIVQTLPEGSLFTTLDEKERKLSAEDLMICDASGGMCIAGVFGGLHSGVTEKTTRIFLESACFDPSTIRKTSFRHGLRTDAATRFEKGIDISGTVAVLRRAAALIAEIAGGAIASPLVDIYPAPQEKKKIRLEYAYLQKLSGKWYAPEAVEGIFKSLGFGIIRKDEAALELEVPYHKRDVSISADLVEEVLRIDGLDEIPIPATISISPSVEENYRAESLKEKISNTLTGLGFSEILTNSITNSAYFSEARLASAVKLLNNLSSELDLLRPSMIHTALEVMAFNINRKNSELRLFEFGKTYSTAGTGLYQEANHLCLYVTGAIGTPHWKTKPAASDIYYIKGVAEALLRQMGISAIFEPAESEDLQETLVATLGQDIVARVGAVPPDLAGRFDIRQPVFVADLSWDVVVAKGKSGVQFREISRFPAVDRDLAMVVPRSMSYGTIEAQIRGLKLGKLRELSLFDIFQSEKIGADKKSLAIHFTFMDEEKTLTDKEIDGWMNKIMSTLQKELQAEIRK